MGERGKKPFEQYLHILQLIDNRELADAVSALQNEIIVLDDIKGWEEFQLAKRSNSFVHGAIQKLKEAPPPIVNALAVALKGTSSPEYLEYLAWQERISIAKECIKTVMQQGGWRPKNSSVETKDDLLALKISLKEGFIDVLESIVELQTAAPAKDQEGKKDTPIIEAVKSWEKGKTRPKIFYTEIDKIKKKLGVGTDQAVNSFCSKYGFSGQEKAFEKSYECHCKTLAKKGRIKPRLTHDRTTV